MIKSSKGKIQDKNIIDSNIYAKLADNETVTGVYTFQSSVYFGSISGRVGVGISTPQAEAANARSIHVHSQSATCPTELRLTNVGSGTGTTDGFMMQLGSAGTNSYLWLYENANLGFATNNSQKMTITGAGNVGIGTVNPTAQLHVNNNAMIGAGSARSLSTGLYLASQTAGVLELNSGSTVATDLAFPDLILSHAQNGTSTLLGRIIATNRNITTADKRNCQIAFVTDGRIDSGKISFATLSASAFADRVVIESNGRLKLVSPSNEVLHSDGSVRINIDTDNNQTDRIFVVSKGSAFQEIMRASEAGTVSIGSAFTTTDKLWVAGSSTVNGTFNTGDNTANFTKFENTGFMTASGSALVWRDDSIAGIAVPGGVSAPDIIALNSTPISGRSFDGGVTMEQLLWANEINHYYAEGTDIYPHLHILPTSNNSGTVQFGMDYVFCNGPGTVAAANVTITGSVNIGQNSAWTHSIIELQAINGSAIKIGNQLAMRIYRDPTLDTYPNDAFLLTIGLHYQQNSLGSRSKFTK